LFLALRVLFFFQAQTDVLKIIALIIAGIFMASTGIYFFSIGVFPVLQLPYVNWAVIGFVLIVASAASFGTAFVVSRFK